MKRYKVLATVLSLAILALAAVPLQASALDTYWYGTGLWSDPSHWTVRVPTPEDTAYITNGGTAQITTDCNAYTVYVGHGYFIDTDSGYVNQYDGTSTISSTLCLGYYASSTYTLIGGQLNVGGEIRVGKDGGYSYFTWLGGNINAHSMAFGGCKLSMGFNFDVAGLANGSLFGSNNISSLSSMDLYVRNGAIATHDNTAASLTVNSLSVGSANETGTYILNNGILSTKYAETIGRNGFGSFTQNGGTNTVSVVMYLGYDSASTGTYSLNGGQLSTASAYIGANDSPNAFDFSIPGGTGTFTQSGGTNTISSNLYLGANNGHGAYNLNNGALSAPSEYVGWIKLTGGTGAFTQAGGTNTASDLYVGYGSGATGTYNLNGGTNTVSSHLYLGYNSGSAGTYNLSGGQLSAKYEYIGGNPLGSAGGTRTLTQTNGTNVVLTSLFLGYFGSPGMYNFSGGELSTLNFYVGADGTLNVTNSAARLTVKGDLWLGGKYTAVPGTTIHMTGAIFDISSTSAADVSGLENTTFVFEGGTKTMDTFEVAGGDLGAVPGGFDNNFALYALTLGGVGVGEVQLVDWEDNGNRGEFGDQPEALYVKHLVLGAGSTLDLNGYHLYYQTLDNQGGTFLNGTPIQAIPEPGTLALIVPALLGFAGIAFRKMRKG